MEGFRSYFQRLVVGNAGQIFPNQKWQGVNSSTYHQLVTEVKKLSQDFEQSRRIAEAIETGTEDLFRDFDLSTFMEHFKLDAFEKTVLALAFKLGGKPDLKTKADAILSTNFPMFGNILSKPSGSHTMLSPDFIAGLLDRFIQVHPPNFNAAAKKELEHNVQSRYLQGNPETSPLPPSQVLAALDLMRLLADRPPNALTLYIHKTGRDFTENEDTCYSYLRNRPANCQLSEEQVSHALMYTTISQTPPHNPSVLVAALRRVLPGTFRWQDVVSYFDHSGARITAPQFLRLYNALLPIAQDESQGFEIWRLWGGEWENPETQMSFVCAYTSLLPDQLDATTIPGLKPTFTLDDYAQAPQTIRETAAYAVRHPLVSEAAMSAIFNVALHSAHASKCTEAKRLFQDVVVPQVPIFVVSAFRVPKPWPKLAEDALVDLFIESLWGAKSHETDFVLNSLWRWDKDWVKMRLIDAHAHRPICLPQIFDHSLRQGWLEELVYLINGFGFDLTALAHAEGYLDLQDWAQKNAERSTEMASALLQFLMIKANLELQYQRSGPGAPKQSTTLQVRTVSAMLQILEEFLPKSPIPELIVVQRQCITAYPRLINYGEGFDDIIDANGRDGNSLPQAANVLMEDHYKKMYSDEVAVRDIVGVLDKYKHSRDPLEQDTFACMIHGLFDEYAHYENYPLEALATTAVLFGGIISHKLVSELPLKIGLGMILEAVRDHQPQEPMYKFGLQALLQLLPRLREWPGFCTQLLLIPGLQNTEARKKAEDVLREHEEETMRARGAGGLPLPPMGNDKITNGNHDEAHGSEQHPPPFTSVNVDPPPPGVVYEDPTAEAQGKIQFFLNNLTETTLQTMYKDLRDMLEAKHQQWFASHLVEERAKMQPNYHQVYLDLVKMFEDKSLWAEVLRETYVSVQRMLNSEVTLQNSTERTHLKNLGGWLGLLTLARNKPIKHRNIAFKQLLMEAHDTKRLLIVIPFVCKVLAQGASSEVFQPPNPWLMDIIHLLIELYHNAELKLNLKFEIEVLCKGLKLDHKSIEPSGEILNRAPVEEVPELNGQELEPYDNTSINGMGSVAGALTTHASLPIPDLSGSLSIPPTEVIDQAKLHSITTQAVTRALQEIIQPVVDRSVTIAAIATQQMIHKDFATEPDENRVRDAAINMVKSTAGSLALVTSKEPLRSNMANYLRALSAEMGLVLPEGIIMLCINSNLDLASSVIEKSAEDRAVPEIEDMIQPEIEARRRHRAQRPNEPYMDPGLTRWAWTIPHPFKLNPSMTGLNAEQMAIYDDFARQPRAIASTTGASHAASTSDARSLANEVLGDQFNAIPAIPTPAETPSLPHLGGQLQHYPQGSGALANGRQAGLNQVDARTIADRVNKLLESLTAAATAATEEHFNELPRAHQVLDIIDALVQLIIKTQQTSEEFAAYAATQIAQLIFRQPGDTLLLESLVHVLETLRKIAGPATSQQIRSLFHQQPAEYFLNLSLISALLGTDLLDWRSIDAAMSMALQQRKEGSIEFLEQLIDLALLSDNPLALYADFVRSLEEAWIWISEDPDVQGGQSLKSKIVAPPPDMPDGLTPEEITAIRQDQMEYVFDEWIHLCNNPAGMSSKSSTIFVQQMHSRKVVSNNEDFLVFVRTAIDKSVDRFEQVVHLNGTLTEAYQAVDALGKMIAIFFQSHEANADGQAARAAFIDSIFALIVLVLNNHHVKRGDAFNSRVFVRLFSVLLHGIHDMEELPETERDRIMLTFADRLYDMRPSVYPGFALGWLTLVTHRVFQPALLQMANNAGWEAYTKLLREVLSYHGELLKSVELSIFAKEMYQAVLKHLIILGHDFPDYVAANHVLLCQSLPPHATQLRSIILLATPASAAKQTDAFQPGLKLDQIADIKEAAISVYDPAEQLRQLGLLDILDQALQNGPSEDAIAQIAHAITRPGSGTTEYGFVPLDLDRQVVDAVISHIGNFAVNRAATRNDASVFVAGAADLKTLQMLITELSPPARYYVLNSMANWLRFTSAHTHYFIQVFLDFFSRDVASTDPEEMDIRQQIVRVLLERLIGYWPYPWGLIITTMELVKNEKYNFFELPFIKSTPEVRRVFEDKVRQH